MREDSSVTTVTFAPAAAAALAVAPNGTIAVIAYTGDGSDRIPGERLDVYSREGKRVASYALPVRLTRTVSVLADGTVAVLANADADSLTERSVLFYDPPETRTPGISCGWRTSAWADR